MMVITRNLIYQVDVVVEGGKREVVVNGDIVPFRTDRIQYYTKQYIESGFEGLKTALIQDAILDYNTRHMIAA